jgi:Transglutaminase-like superfamily/TgpA N-terminal domain
VSARPASVGAAPPAEARPAPPWLLDGLTVTLLLVPLVGLGVASSTWLPLVPLALLTLAHPLLSRRGVEVRVPLVGYAVLGLLCTLLGQTVYVGGYNGLRFTYGYYYGLFLLGVALAQLYGPPNPRRLPRVLLCGLLALGGSGGPGGGLPARIYLMLCAAYAVPLLLALRIHVRVRPVRPRAPRARLPGVALLAVLALGLTAGLSTLANALYSDLERVYYELTGALPSGSRGAGFSGQAQLGSVVAQQQQPDRVALRVYADQDAPGYLRARAFTYYRDAGWKVFPDDATPSEVDGQPLQPLEGRVELLGRPQPAADATPELTVYPEGGSDARAVFLPLSACAIDLDADLLRLSPGGVLAPEEPSSLAVYAVHRDEAPLFATRETQLEPYLEQPAGPPELLDALDATLARLPAAAREVDPSRPLPAVSALVTHFERNYDYKLGIRFKRGEEPLAAFLTTKDHGHCELFASSGVLLLRRLGIPARYVTGYLCVERNPAADGLWLARPQHAHAWIEYYDPQRGWQTAELTPSAGVPQAQPRSGLQARWEAWRAALATTWAELFPRGVGGALRQGVSFLGDGVRWVLAAWWRLALVMALAGVAVWLQRGSAVAVDERPERALPPSLAARRDEVRAVEQRLAGKGLVRSRGETLLEYAERIGAAPAYPEQERDAARLREYSSLRYAPWEAGILSA